jgi:hypothetical protein
MKTNRNLSLLSFAFSIMGCSLLFGAGQPAASPSPASTATPRPTRRSTDIPSATGTFTPRVTATATQLPYTMVEMEETSEDIASVLFRECQKAKSSGLAPFLQIYADWCPACKALKRGMKDERMMEAYRGTYILLANVDIWYDQFPKVGIYVTGVPSIFELTSEGKPTGRLITGAAWGENTPENMAPPLDDFFHPD